MLEAEIRFLELQRGDHPAEMLKYRHRPGALVRYREFDWRVPAGRGLRRIIAGPAADRPSSFQFARNCLRAFHPEPEGVVIDRSRIPYRVVPT